MYTLSEMKTQVGERVGKTDATFLGKIEDWINGRYIQVGKAVLWKDMTRTDTVSSTADQEFLILPQDCQILLNIHDRTNDVNLTPANPSIGGRAYADVQDSSATPNTYWIEETTVLNQPSSASTITIVSSSASDTSETVRVHGRQASGQNVATGTLNGTTPANTLTACTQVDKVSKDSATVGFVTIMADAGATTVAVIYPREKTARYKKLHLLQRPSGALTYNITYKRRLPKLEFAEDVPILDVENILIIGAYADALYQQRRFSQAAVQEQRFISLLDDFIFEQHVQAENVPRTLPHIQLDAVDQESQHGAY